MCKYKKIVKNYLSKMNFLFNENLFVYFTNIIFLLGVSDLTKKFVVVVEIPLETIMYNCLCKNACCGRYVSYMKYCLSLDLVDCHYKIKMNMSYFRMNLNRYPSSFAGLKCLG